MKRLIYAALCFAVILPLNAQGSASPSLDDVLNKLDAAYESYLHRLPAFSATEKVESTVSSRSQAFPVQTVVSQSLFRVAHAPKDSGEDLLSESRVLQLVNNAPPSAEARLSGPAIATGIFTYAPMLASAKVRGCFDYKMKLHDKHGKLQAIELQFKQRAPESSQGDCPPSEYAYGTVMVEPESFHILSIEKTVPAFKMPNRTWGKWNWKVEYAPVHLGTEEFWLPKHIVSASSSLSDSRFIPLALSRGLDSVPLDRSQSEWLFNAHYSDFQLFHAESHVLPGARKKSQQ